MSSDSEKEVARLLRGWSEGDFESLGKLITLTMGDLRDMAGRIFRHERQKHTLQPTAVISELYLRLRGNQELSLESRDDFLRFAAATMRRLLVDYARMRGAQRRGGDHIKIPLDRWQGAAREGPPLDLLDLNVALKELEELDPKLARLVELKIFIGLKDEDSAQVLDVSRATIKRWWVKVKLWLSHRLEPKVEGGQGDASLG